MLVGVDNDGSFARGNLHRNNLLPEAAFGDGTCGPTLAFQSQLVLCRAADTGVFRYVSRR